MFDDEKTQPSWTPKRIIVIRRDNIGDPVCTTPLFSALRARFPEARIAAFVNSYNMAVLANNPDVDEVCAYTKAKHRPKGKTVIGVYWDRLRLFAQLPAQALRFGNPGRSLFPS